MDLTPKDEWACLRFLMHSLGLYELEFDIFFSRGLCNLTDEEIQEDIKLYESIVWWCLGSDAQWTEVGE